MLSVCSLPYVDMLPDIGLLHERKPFKLVLDENSLADDLRGRNVLVTGGTGGIGAAVMLCFATRGANVHIAGRNADAATKLLDKARETSNWPEHEQELEFHSLDASSMDNCKRFAGDMLQLFEAKGGLDWLVMTQGGIGNGERRETVDGHEWFLALHDLSRYVVAASLMPVLKMGNNRGVVIDVLSAGVWNKLDMDNLELKGKSANFFEVASRDGPIHEVMTQEFNDRCPEVAYNHLYPGPLRSSITSPQNSNSGWIIKLGFTAASWVIGHSVEHFAEIAFNVATKWEKSRESETSEECRTWGATGEKVQIREFPRRVEVREEVWRWLETETGVILKVD